MSLATIRPSRARYKKSVLAGAWIGIALVVVSLIRLRDNLPLAIGLIAVALVVTLGFVWLYFRNTRVEFEPGRVTTTNLFGARREVSTASVGSTIMVQQLITSPTLTVATLLLLDGAGAKLVRLRGEVWPVESMVELGEFVSTSPVIIAEPVTLAQLRARYPLAVVWWEAHPIGLAAIICGVVVVAALGVFVAFS